MDAARGDAAGYDDAAPLDARLLITAVAPSATHGTAAAFVDVAADPARGLHYRRAPSRTYAQRLALAEAPSIVFPDDMLRFPHRWRGSPGVALIDVDADGDLDLYVSNGPGRANSLFRSAWMEEERLRFDDVAASAGVAAIDHDSGGVCAGDTDNDGDVDLIVLSVDGPNRFFVNRGDGIFDDATAASGLADGPARASNGCALADVDRDGLLDLAIVNGYADQLDGWHGLMLAHAHEQHSRLFRNVGANHFVDISAAAGVEDLDVAPAAHGQATISWAVALVDIDQDGDVDWLQGDDQGAVPPASAGGVDRGLIRLLRNDGSGRFDDVTRAVGLGRTGSWMGLAIADFDGDRHLDLFASNAGDWANTLVASDDPLYGTWTRHARGDHSARWLLGSATGAFRDPGTDALRATPFGWGTSPLDVDLDGDVDLIMHGGYDLGPFGTADNPGVLLINDGAAGFRYDGAAYATTVDHARRLVEAVAVGDLDRDGRDDIVTVSSADIPTAVPLYRYRVRYGTPLDGRVGALTSWLPTDDPRRLVFAGLPENHDGSLTLELQRAAAGTGASAASVGLSVRGSVGTPAMDGRVNRDGIGAVLIVTPRGGVPVTRPVQAGSSHASQDARTMTFGLGTAAVAQVEVLWPGGVRNRLDGVPVGARLTLPEIPCGYDADWDLDGDGRRDDDRYRSCVDDALDALVAAGVLDAARAAWHARSAWAAYAEAGAP
ncbi:MAG: CRTAC1 family protein [Acidobacteriota bacterium]